MFCTNCGANLADGTVFCTSCGAKLGGGQQQNSTQGTAVNNQGSEQYVPSNAAGSNGAHQGNTQYIPNNTENPYVGNQGASFAPNNAANPYGAGQTNYPNQQATYAKPSFLQDPQNKKFVIVGIVVAAVVVLSLLIAIVKGVSTPGYERPIKYTVEGIQNGKVKTLLKAYPDFMAEEMEDQIKYLEYVLESIVDEYKDEYGKGFKISYKVEDKDKLSKKEIKAMEDQIDSWYDEKVDIKEGYELEIEISIDGKKGDDEDTTYFTVYKIGSKWYILDQSFGM